jgi:subtilisin family serine protease
VSRPGSLDRRRRAPRSAPIRPALYVGTVLCLVAGLLAAQVPAATAPGQTGQTDEGDPLAGSVVDSELLERLDDVGEDRDGGADAGDQLEFVVEYSARPDLQPAYEIGNPDRRAELVTDSLQETAEDSQQEAIELVEEDPDATAQSFWLSNALFVEGDRELVEDIAELEGVAKIRLERTFDRVEPEPGTRVEVAQADPEWGVARIGADQVWEQGVTGEGVVVASIDTGVELTHPALVDQYRGNLGDGGFDHDYNWWDPSGSCPDPEPCDDTSHGTHTMGTMAGGDGPGPFSPDIGVAPGARWIAAKGCGFAGCSEEALLSSGQWVLEPTDLNGENPDPARRPHIVSNSWSGPPGEPFYMDVVQTWRAAGIIPVFAAGNTGLACGSVQAPGDFPEAISVGSIDKQDKVSPLSARGPSSFGEVKPDVTAPGVDITSSVLGGGYEAHEGTSMATPDVAGTLALMLSAEPDLVGDVDRSADVLRSTALDIVDTTCGGAPDGDPNNVYGDGRIDALRAVDVATGGAALSLLPTFTVSGRVTSSESGAAVPRATVTALDTPVEPAVTDGRGRRATRADTSPPTRCSTGSPATAPVTGTELRYESS